MYVLSLSVPFSAHTIGVEPEYIVQGRRVVLVLERQRNDLGSKRKYG